MAKINSENLNNSGGISFRAKRVPNSDEVMDCQADISYIPANVLLLFSNFSPKDTPSLYQLWGILIDENHTNTSIYPNTDIFPVIFKN